MLIFTKITKIPYMHLRRKDHVSVFHVDDSFLQGKACKECLQNIIDIITVLQKLGFTVQPIKLCHQN